MKTIRRAALCCAEWLEGRTLFAWNMALSTNADFGVSSSTASGITTFTATATGANLSWSSIQIAFQAGNSVIVSSGSTGAEAGNITDQSGAQLSFSGTNLNLTIQSGTGTGLVGNISVKEIRMSGAGSSIVLAANGSMSTGLLSGGSNASPAALTSAVITAATGSIAAMTSPFPGAIDATTVALKARTGVGSSTTPLSTQTANLSAQTNTGDIIISNIGNLNINGGVISGVNGLQITTFGNIRINNAGSVTVTTSGDIVSAFEVVAITTSSGNILLGGNNGAGFDSSSGAVYSNSGSIVLNAAGNLMIGDTATQSYADIVGGSDIDLTAGGNITIDESSCVSAHVTGDVKATAGGNISVLDTTPSLAGASIASQSGDIVLTTGIGGTLTLNSNTTAQGLHTLWTGHNYGGSVGGIRIGADHFVLNSATDDIRSGVSIQPVTPSESIQLGTTTDSELDLSNAELSKIDNGNVQVGAAADTGAIAIAAAINLPTHSRLALVTGGSINDFATADAIIGPLLVMSAGTGIGSSASPLSTQITRLAATTNTGGIFIANTGALTLAEDPVSGNYPGVEVVTSGDIQLNNTGSVTLTLGGAIIRAPGDITVTNSNGDIVLGDGDTGIDAGIGAPYGSIDSTGGSVMLSATGNILVGNFLTRLDASVVSGGSIDLNSGGNITISGDSAVSAHGSGTISAIAAGDIALEANFEQGAKFATQGGSIDLTTGSGGKFSADSFATSYGGHTLWTSRNGGNGNITINAGSFYLSDGDDLAAGAGTVNLIINGSITDAGTITGITAGTLAINASTGIGTSAAPLVTAVANLAAQTATGGIFVRNTGNLNINGGTTAPMTGLVVTNSGDIVLNNAGSLSITTNNDIVQTPGNVTLTASGNSSDILTGGRNGGAINAGGTANLAAGRDLLAGSAVAWGDIIGQSIIMNVGRDVISTGTTHIQGGSVTINAAGNITMTASSGGISGGNGSVTLNAGGVFTDSATIRADGPISITAASLVIDSLITIAIGSNNGAVTLTPTAGDVDLAAGTEITGAAITQTSGANLSTYAGTLVANNGAIALTGNSFSLTGSFGIADPMILTDTGSATLSGAAPNAITKNGPGTLLLEDASIEPRGGIEPTLALTVNAGAATIAANTSTGIRKLNLTSLGVAAGAKVVFANSSATLGDYSHHANRTLAIVDAGGLNISSGGTLDLGDNSMLLKYLAANKSATDTMVNNLLSSGYAGGAWSGTGINSSEANYDAYFGSASRAVGWADQFDVGVNSFEGDSADVSDGNEIMIKFTYYGDTDLDGKVAASDSAAFSNGVHLTSGNAYWEFGDIDYSGGKPNASDSQLFSTGLAAYKTFGLL